MKKNNKKPLVQFILFALLLNLPIQRLSAKEYQTVIVQIGKSAGAIEKKVAQLLVDRLVEAGIANTRIENEIKANRKVPFLFSYDHRNFDRRLLASIQNRESDYMG